MVGTIIDTIPAAGRKMMYTSGWPKNQNRCCHNSASPPFSGMKNGQPNARSSSSMMVARITAGKANTIMPAKISIVQANIGILSSDMPGARVRRTPTMISIAPAIAEISMKPMPEQPEIGAHARANIARSSAADT